MGFKMTKKSRPLQKLKMSRPEHQGPPEYVFFGLFMTIFKVIMLAIVLQ